MTDRGKMMAAIAAAAMFPAVPLAARAIAMAPEEDMPELIGIDPADFDEAPRSRSTPGRKDQQPGWSKPNILKKYRKKAQP